MVDEVCEVVTLVTDEIVNASSDRKDIFINGIGKNGDELISLFELSTIIEENV